MRFSLFSFPRKHLGVSALAWCTALLLSMGFAPVWAQLFPTTKPAATLTLAPTTTVGPMVQTAQVRAELMAHAPHGVQAGQTFWVGLQLQHEPHWHTYWLNPGDSGLPTQLNWTLPQGLSAGDTLWPMPKKIPIGSLTNYGYENSTLLVVPIQATKDFKATGPLTVQLKANWLVCRQECIPQEGVFALTVPAQSGTVSQAPLFEETLKHQTRPLLAVDKASASSATLSDNGTGLHLQLKSLPAAWRGQSLSLFPITPEIIVNSAVAGRDWTQQWAGDVWTARLPVSQERLESPQTLNWLVALGDPPVENIPGLTVPTPVTGPWPAPASVTAVPPALAQALKANAANAPGISSAPPLNRVSIGLWIGALVGAFMGGLLLNLMPCVFPVLAIKVIGFAQPGQTRTTHHWAGWAYTAGVVTSFVLLGGLMLALRAGGSQLGWGFQLQSPAVVAGLAVLFTLLGLNLSGLFEFGQFIPSRLAAMQNRHPGVDALWSGVLAVVVASPCTAPFMGASLGLAIGLPAWQALPIFAAMGAGLALPYLAASLWPAVARALPRPGAWMETLRQLLAFPMFATVVWLLWVLGQQTGMDGASALLGVLVALAFVIWAWGLASRARWVLLVLGVTLTFWLGQATFSTWTPPPLSASGAESSDATASGTARWQPWSPQTLQTRLDAGQTVFVDFTAAWCVTCQYNKKTTLSDTKLLQAIEERHVALLRADWTRQDPAITQTLNQLGRSGVPVYAVYTPGQPPKVLSELPSVQEILDALRQ